MPAEEDHATISEMADRLGLEGDERDEYITEHMGRLKYRPRTVWDDPEDEDGNGGGDNVKPGFFGKKAPAKKTAAPRTREVPDRKQPYGY